MDIMRRGMVLLAVVAVVAFAPTAHAAGNAKRVGYPPPKHRTTSSTTLPATTTTVTTRLTTTTSTSTTTLPTTTVTAPLAMTVTGTTETITADGTYYVTATMKWTNTRPAQTLMVCVNNLSTGGGGCIGLEPTATQYTTESSFVGEILTGTTLVYRVVACFDSCWETSPVTVFVPAVR